MQVESYNVNYSRFSGKIPSLSPLKSFLKITIGDSKFHRLKNFHHPVVSYLIVIFKSCGKKKNLAGNLNNVIFLVLKSYLANFNYFSWI